MQFDYDKESDSLYIMIAAGGSTESEEVSEDIILDYNAAGHVVGIDIQHASRHADLAAIQVRGFMPEVDVRAALS